MQLRVFESKRTTGLTTVGLNCLHPFVTSDDFFKTTDTSELKRLKIGVVDSGLAGSSATVDGAFAFVPILVSLVFVPMLPSASVILVPLFSIPAPLPSFTASLCFSVPSDCRTDIAGPPFGGASCGATVAPRNGADNNLSYKAVLAATSASALEYISFRYACVKQVQSKTDGVVKSRMPSHVSHPFPGRYIS